MTYGKALMENRPRDTTELLVKLYRHIPAHRQAHARTFTHSLTLSAPVAVSVSPTLTRSVSSTLLRNVHPHTPPFTQAEANTKKYGKVLMENRPRDTTELLETL